MRVAWQSATVSSMSISDVLQSEWRWRRGPTGWGGGHKNDRGAPRRTLIPWDPPRGTKILFCARGLTWFLPYKRYQFLYNTSSPVILFRLTSLKGTAKITEAEHPEVYLNLFSPEKVRRAPRHFCMGVCPPLILTAKKPLHYGQLINNWRTLSTKPRFIGHVGFETPIVYLFPM